MVAIELDDNGAAMMLIGYVRYALGRESVVVGMACDTVRILAPQLQVRDVWTIRRDIAEQERDGYGRECDVRAWRGLLTWLDAHLAERERLSERPEYRAT